MVSADFLLWYVAEAAMHGRGNGRGGLFDHGCGWAYGDGFGRAHGDGFGYGIRGSAYGYGTGYGFGRCTGRGSPYDYEKNRRVALF